jgi:long-chain acyl-CoA synthetase
METNKPGSIGTSIEGVEMAILSAEGSALGSRSVGEIVVRGPNVMLGYWNDAAATAEVIRGGWLHTGDMGWRDEDGDYFVVDRLKDVIIVSGQNVYPAEVERVLRRHPAIADVAVFGRPHRVLGEKVCAHVVARPGSQPTTLELRSFCTASLAPFKVPTEFEFVGGIPRTPTGKVLKRQLRPLPERTI